MHVISALTSPMSTVMRPMPASEHKTQREEFFAKNERLGRPTSPHLTIYSPQMTSMLSITHRGTGVVMSCALSGFAIGGSTSCYTSLGSVLGT